MNNLDNLRNEIGLTLRELEEYVGITHSVLSYLINEKRPFRQEHIDALTSFFSVTTDYLLGRSDNGYIVHTQIGDDIVTLRKGEYEQRKEKISNQIIKRKNDITIKFITPKLSENIKIGEYVVYREIEGDISSNNFLTKEIISLIESMDENQLIKTKKLIEDIIL